MCDHARRIGRHAWGGESEGPAVGLGSRVNRRRLVVVAAASGIVGALIVAMALPAFAHHPVLSGSTSCPYGVHVITWTIGNSESGADKTMTITSALASMNGTNYAVVGYSTTVAPSGSTQGTTEVPGNLTGTVKLVVSG